MTEQEIIKAWKENEKAFGLLPEEMQKWAKQHNSKGNFWWLSASNEGVWDKSDKTCDFFGYYTYRLRPDYPEEPELIEVEIKDVYRALHIFLNDDSMWIDYTSAPTVTCIDGQKVRFAGYKYGENGLRPGFVWTMVNDTKLSFPTHAVYQRVEG